MDGTPGVHVCQGAGLQTTIFAASVPQNAWNSAVRYLGSKQGSLALTAGNAAALRWSRSILSAQLKMQIRDGQMRDACPHCSESLAKRLCAPRKTTLLESPQRQGVQYSGT
jgi:hypothetical protein